MILLASVAVGAFLVLVCGSCRFSMTKAVAESPDPFVRMAEVEQKRQRVLEEIGRLGADHPWAGVYYGNADVPSSLVVAPESGCVSTIFGCFGLRDSSWSPADVSLTLGQCMFSANNEVRGHLVAFGETYELISQAGERGLRDARGVVYWRQPSGAEQIEKSR